MYKLNDKQPTEGLLWRSKVIPISTDNVVQIWLRFFQLTGAPATSPGSTGSGSNLSPSCGESSAASAHNPAPSPLSSHRSLPGNVPEAMGGQQVTQKLLWINISFESVSKRQFFQGQQQLDSSLAALSSSYQARLQVPSSMMQGLATASPYPGQQNLLKYAKNLNLIRVFHRSSVLPVNRAESLSEPLNGIFPCLLRLPGESTLLFLAFLARNGIWVGFRLYLRSPKYRFMYPR